MVIPYNIGLDLADYLNKINSMKYDGTDAKERSMNEEIRQYIEKYGDQTKQRFCQLYQLLCESTSRPVTEKLWASLPSFYSGDRFIRVIPFKDHVNIEAGTITLHTQELSEYKITSKGMLQIYHNQPIPADVLGVVFRECLEG